MSQSPNVIQEPSMDELLASIREIIEENAGIVPNDNVATRAPEANNMQASHVNDDMSVANARVVSHPVQRVNNNVPVQDAMNALAERIGLRSSQAVEQEQPVRPVAATPTVKKITVLKEPKSEVVPHPVQQPSQYQPQQPQVQVQPVMAVHSQPQVQPSIQPQVVSNPVVQQPMPSAAASQQAYTPPPVTPPKARYTETQKDMDEIEKNFRAEFEKSAEGLLRPYIAQWLDEHFNHLFEKILREEIQRLVQTMRR